MNPYQETFRYLQDASEGWRNEVSSACVVCEQVLPGYGFIEIHEEGYDEYHVCEPCLVSGRLEEKDLRINEGDVETICEPLDVLMPELSEEERDALAFERTDEIELRTPRPSVLNFFTWPAHCGDYCVYFRRVKADDVNRLASDGEGKNFLASHLHPDDADVDETFLQNVWEDNLSGFMRFYLWQCRHCSEYLLTCDSD